jgi:GntP family gluconate:H+ symporter
MLLRVAQGAATVARVTVSEMLGPLITQEPLPYHPVYLLIATGGGGIMLGWMNDSGFWVYITMTGLTEMEALKTKSMSLSVMGLTAFLFAWLGTILFPMV